MFEKQRVGIVDFMKKFTARPLNVAFINPVNPEIDGIPDYYDVIKKPMDLSTINGKIERNEYHDACEWYDDVCLIYENAKEYHGLHNNVEWANIADFLLKDFKSTAKKFNFKNYAEWEKLLTKEMDKLGKTIEKSPVPQGIDDLVHSCIKNAESCPEITPNEVARMVQVLKKSLEDTEKKRCIIEILKKTQKDFSVPKDAESVTIEIDKLGPNALNALNLYTRGFD